MNLFLIFQYSLICAFVVLLGTFVLVMGCESVEDYVAPLFGLDAKNDTLTFLGIGMGGVLLALQALMSYKRAKALEDTARAQVEANQNTEQGQRQERLKNAIEHLGHTSDSVRLGGAYELFHLAEDTAKDKKDLRQSILNILCAHIRQTTGEDEYQKKYPSKPSKELRDRLEPHLDQPVSHELPENSGAIIAPYTAEEAERWIAEYNAAMSEVPTESGN